MSLRVLHNVNEISAGEFLQEIKRGLDKYYATCFIDNGTKNVSTFLKVKKDNRTSPDELKHIVIAVTGKDISFPWTVDVCDDITHFMGVENCYFNVLDDPDYEGDKTQVSVYG